MDIIITFSTQEIIGQNKCQIGFLHKFLLKNFNQKLMMNEITSSMLDFPSTSDYDEVKILFLNQTFLEPTIKHLIKETSLGSRAALNMVIRGKYLRAEMSLIKNVTLKATRVCSRYNIVTKQLSELKVEFILSYPNFKSSYISRNVVAIFNP